MSEDTKLKEKAQGLRYWRVHILDPYSGNVTRCARGAEYPSQAVAFAFWDMPINEDGREHVEMVHNEAGVQVLVREISYKLYREADMEEDPEKADAIFEEVDELMMLEAITAGEEAP